ncbi:MAG TPA: type I-E CRISPR-associated endonuclease Cas1e [Phycisphaerales bacterium]|nr:type I-E CRISPR-associated endonuclease Cas1e [Phycisphaerales bacterium]
MKTSLFDLGRFDDRLSFLYVDRAIVKHTANAIAVHELDGVTEVPLASLALLMLGPGTKITHQAVKALADNNCLVVWAGEFGVRFYACGMGGSRHSRNLLRQARLALDERTRLRVVVRMYCARFTEESIDPGLTLQQLRGKEGIRVRQAYAEASKATGVPWQGRDYKRKDWFAGDPVNRALSAANACLYGLVHAAILSGGYSPAIGFIHSGKQLSFVYDVADLYKAELTIPLAFEVAARHPQHLEREVRVEARRRFFEARLMKRLLPDIARVLDVPEAAEEADEFADDPALPAALWEPRSFTLETPIGEILAQRPPEGDAA